MAEIKLKNDEIKKLLSVEDYDFPKYTTQLINLANGNAQGTRSKIVGQMSELIQEFPGNSLEEWENWYLSKNPHALKNATDKIISMINKFKAVINQIDEKMVSEWVKDLVIVKTFVGLKFQEAILKKIAEIEGKTYRLATPEEESQGIDGFIGNKPYSIKPTSYKQKATLQEDISVDFIYYEKTKTQLKVTY